MTTSELQFGKFLVLKRIASGGMGEVFLAKQQGPEGFEKYLVLKRILDQHSDNHNYVEMFFAEARLAARLTHQNIVQIYEMGAIDDSYYISMEFVNGKSLADIITACKRKNTEIPQHLVIQLIMQLCEGLAYAHSLANEEGAPLNIVHRDINPRNVLVSYRGDVKVIDFGIAKSDVSGLNTQSGTIKGQFAYMSPEQAAASPLDHRADIVSVGIVLYELLTLHNPFHRDSLMQTLDAVGTFTPLPPCAVDEKLACFDDVVTKALAKNREERYQSCTEMRDALRAIGVVGEPTLAEFMKELFAEQIEREQSFFKTMRRGGNTPPPLGHGGSKTPVEMRPDLMGFATRKDVSAQIALDDIIIEESPAKKSRVGLVLAATAALFGVAVVSAFLALALRPEPPPAAIPSGVLPAEVARGGEPASAPAYDFDKGGAEKVVVERGVFERTRRALSSVVHRGNRGNKSKYKEEEEAPAAVPPAPSVQAAPAPRNDDVASPPPAHKPRRAIDADDPWQKSQDTTEPAPAAQKRSLDSENPWKK